MIKVVTRSGNLANILKVTSSVGATSITQVAPAVPEEEPDLHSSFQRRTTAYTSACDLPVKKLTAVSGPAFQSSVRYNHFDAKVPDFSAYKRECRKNPNCKSEETESHVKFYTCIGTGIGGAIVAYSGKSTIQKFLASMGPAADVLALAKIEINKSDVPEGKNVTFKWRGKPLFVRHRTDEEIEKEAAVDLSILKDPQPDSERARDPKWLIVIGVCTHLGCVPIPNAGDWGGYYCPCHGSHYDAAGRIRKGPAPLNLEIPPYEFVEERIVVG